MRGIIKKWGNSAAIRLPAAILRSLGIGPEDVLDIRLEKGCIVLEPVVNEQPSLAALLEGVHPGNLHAEIDFGTPGG